jgi:hypothetical protein
LATAGATLREGTELAKWTVQTHMATPATPLPPVVFEDGLGQRRRVVGARNQTLSVLFLDGEMTADPAFETALRDRLAQLAGFHHDGFARARGVVHVTKTPLRLALASDFVDGVRLSEMLALADERLIPLEINAAISVIRQLTAALAALHEQTGTSHGALAPERIIVTGDGRVVVTEYVLGSALEQLRFSAQRYWKELRIPLPHAAGLGHFDRRADATQLGAIALALIVGRPLRDDEYPGRVSEIVDSVRAISANGLAQLPPAVRTWLQRALQIDPRRSFTSVTEAYAELDGIYDVDDRTARQALRTFAATCQEALTQEEATAEVRLEERRQGVPVDREERRQGVPVDREERRQGVPADREPAPAQTAAPADAAREDRVRDLRIVPRPESTGRLFTTVDDTPSVAVSPAVQPEPPAGVPVEDPADEQDEPASNEAGPAWKRVLHNAVNGVSQHRVAAIVAVLVVIASAGTFAARGYFAAAPIGTLIVNTNPTGVAVVIDGQHRGSTPLTLDLAPGDHLLQIVSNDGHVRKIPVTIAEGREVAQFIELPTVAPAAADGQLQVRSEPAGARVLIDGQYRGVAPLTVEALTPGPHTVKLEDGTASVTQQVTIEAGLTASLVIPLTAARPVPVTGQLSIAAPVDVQIYENQRLLGSSNGEPIMLSAGRHELDIVNEALGYRVTRAVQVTAGVTASVRLEWPKGSLALNATPWADVWLNGERLGETPIGNVQVPIGAHRVVFRHPELGEQAHNITVTLNAPARVSADMRKR